MNSPEKNPFDELYDLVGECEVFEEQIDRIRALLSAGSISEELNAIILAEALSMPVLATQNIQLANAVKELQSKLESLMESDSEPTNILHFPKKPIIN